MADTRKLDDYFNQPPTKSENQNLVGEARHTRLIRRAKLILPSAAAILISLLLIIPHLSTNIYDLKLDITRPRSGELEKLHIENTVFNLTDKDNKVNNLTASKIDETSPGSKIVKLTNPEGIIPSTLESWVNLKSPTGFYNQTEKTLLLTDNVELFYSDGMNINVFDANFDFNKSYAWSRAPLTGQGIFGDISAEGFDFYSDTGVLTFLGKTNLKINSDSFKSRNP